MAPFPLASDRGWKVSETPGASVLVETLVVVSCVVFPLGVDAVLEVLLVADW